VENNKKLGSSGIYELAAKGDIPALLRIVEESPHHNDLKFAIRALGDLKSQEAVDPIIPHLLSQFISVRSAAIRALGEIGNARALKPLTLILENEKDPSRFEALDALGNFDHPAAIKALIKVLSDPSADIAERAIVLLQNKGNPVVEPLLAELQIAETGVRQKIIKILGTVGDEKTGQFLMEMVKDTEAPQVCREEAVLALAGIRKGWDLDYILQSVSRPLPAEDKNYALRCYLVTLLGETGNKAVTKTLLELLLNKSEELRVRYHAASAIGRLGDTGAVEALIGFLEDSREQTLKEAAFEAILALNSKRSAPFIVDYLKKDSSFMDQHKLMTPADM